VEQRTGTPEKKLRIAQRGIAATKEENLTTDEHKWTPRGIAATKGIKATTDYTDFTD